MDVSIIIVNYNTKELLKNCLISIFEQTKNIAFEVIVSDNGSIDGSIEMIKTTFPQVILLENKKNLGFGAANNRGLEISKGEFVFYLNSDTILLNNAVKIFFDYWKKIENKEQLGALGCNLINLSGSYIHSFGNFPKYTELVNCLFKNLLNSILKPLIRHFKKRTKKVNKYIGNVGYITGADLFLKNNSNAKFDEDFFMYYEETDLEYKLLLQDKMRKIIDGPQIIHLEGASAKKERERGYDFSTFAHKEMWYSACVYLKKNDNVEKHYQNLRRLLRIIWSLPRNKNNCSEYIKKINEL